MVFYQSFYRALYYLPDLKAIPACSFSQLLLIMVGDASDNIYCSEFVAISKYVVADEILEIINHDIPYFLFVQIAVNVF